MAELARDFDRDFSQHYPFIPTLTRILSAISTSIPPQLTAQDLTPLSASVASLAPPDSAFSSHYSAPPLTAEFGFYPTQSSRSQSNSNSNSGSHSHSRDRLQPPNPNAAQHFYATVVQSNKSFLPFFHNVVAWMLKRDLLVTLHLHVRVVATVVVKQKCRDDMERERAERVTKWPGRNARFQTPHTGQEGGGSGSLGRRNRGPTLAEEVIVEDEGGADEKTPRVSEEEMGDGDEDPDLVKPSSFEGSPNWFSLSPREARRRTRRLPSTSSSRALSSEYDGPYMSRRRSSARDHPGSASRGRSRILEDVISENPFYESGEEDDGGDDDEGDTEDSEDEDDESVPSIIPDPGRATPRERRWLSKMSEGKSSWIAKRFETQVFLGHFNRSFSDAHSSIHQYFDGKCTDDEILYHADISRKQLREVLHHYDEYVSVFFHSSISIFLFRVTPWARPSVYHPLIIHWSPASGSRPWDPTLTLAKPSKCVRMGYKGAMASNSPTNESITSLPHGFGFSIPFQSRLSPGYMVSVSKSPLFEMQLSVRSFFTVTSWARAISVLLLVRLRVPWRSSPIASSLLVRTVPFSR